MMALRCWRRLMFFALAVTGLSLSTFAYSNTGAGALKASIRLSEQRIDRGTEVVPLLFGSIPQDVDINSVIRVQIERETLNEHLRSHTAVDQVRAHISTWSPILEEAENLLRSAATAVDVANDAAIRAIEAEARGPEGEASLRELGTRSEAAIGNFLRKIDSYRDTLKSAPDFEIRFRAEQLSERFNAVATEISAGRQGLIGAGFAPGSRAYNVSSANLSASAVVGFLNRELQWIQERQRQAVTAIRDQLETVALALVARSPAQDGSMRRLHIEYYDDLPPGEVVYLDKVNWAEDSIAMQQMLAAIRPVVAAMEDLRTRRLDTAEAIERILQVNGVDIQPVVRAIDDLEKSVASIRAKDWQLEIERLRSVIESVIAEAPADAQQLRGAWSGLRDALAAAENQIDSLAARERIQALKEMADQGVGTADPVDALTAFLGRVDDSIARTRAWVDGLEGLKKPLGDTSVELNGLLAAFDDFASTVSSLPDTQQEQLGDAIKTWQSALFSDVRDRVDTVKTETETLVKALKKLNANAGHREQLASQLRLYANLNFEVPDDALYVPGDRLKDTFVDLRTLPERRDGSVVILDAYLYRLDPSGTDEAGRVKVGERLDQERQQLVLHRYGWYSMPNVGVAYVSSRDTLEGQDARSKQFTAQASWLFRYRTWADAKAEEQPAGNAAAPLLAPKPWYEDIGVGPHIVAVDMNKDSQQEVGLGLTVSFLDDFIQLGYGWNLTLDRDQYWFVGLKLLQFGSTMGVQTQPSPAAFQTGTQ